MPRAIPCCLALVGMLALPGCGKRASQPAEHSIRAADAPRTPDAGTPDAAPLQSPIPAQTRQIVVGVADSWDATEIALSLHERAPGGAWQRIGSPWPATVGHAGLAWGRGLHGKGAPQEQPGPQKHEGDGKAPAGAFALTHAYGYAPSARTRMPYARVTAPWRCVNDSSSTRYNQVFDSTGAKRDWSTAERMRRSDPLYAWVVEIAHNPDAAPQGGSCIFFHVWSDPGVPTLGCTAMERAQIEDLMSALDPEATPVYVLLPRERYIELAPQWGLPALAAAGAGAPTEK